jgi:hypothetical protein
MPKLNLSVSPGLKSRLDALSGKYALPQAELVRLVLKTGLPLLELALEAEVKLIEAIRLYRSKAEASNPWTPQG